jgi:hypothetical protein
MDVLQRENRESMRRRRVSLTFLRNRTAVNSARMRERLLKPKASVTAAMVKDQAGLFRYDPATGLVAAAGKETGFVSKMHDLPGGGVLIFADPGLVPLRSSLSSPSLIANPVEHSSMISRLT